MLPARLEEKTIKRPSLVQASPPPNETSEVSRRAWPPAEGMTQMSPIGIPLSF
jgi:hypothetical protein